MERERETARRRAAYATGRTNCKAHAVDEGAAPRRCLVLAVVQRGRRYVDQQSVARSIPTYLVRSEGGGTTCPLPRVLGGREA
jgi:hypothetical protein